MGLISANFLLTNKLNNDIIHIYYIGRVILLIITYTGKYFDYNNITKDSIDIKDIIPAITRLNRFMGHTTRPYGVGEHTLMCYLVAKKLGYTPREQLLVLMHDFAEAYCGDVNTDLKELLPQYKLIEKEVEMAIYEHFGVKPPTPSEEIKVKTVDLTMLIIEMRDITHHNHNKKIDEVREFVNFDALEDDNLRIYTNDVISEKYIIDYLFEIFKSLMNKIKES